MTPASLSYLRIENIPKVLIEIAETIANLTGTLNPVEIYTTDYDSIKHQREKVFEAYMTSTTYNPHLTYSYAEEIKTQNTKKTLNHLLALLRSLKSPDKSHGIQLFQKALLIKILDDLSTCMLIEGLQQKNESQIARALSSKYPGTDQALLDSALADYIRLTHSAEDPLSNSQLTTQQIAWLKGKEYSPQDTAEAFTWALRRLGILKTADNLKGFCVVISKDTTSIDVRSKSHMGPAVFIPHSKKLSAYQILPLIMHEIVGHARQDINGEELFYLGGGRLKTDNEELYEGLGKRTENATYRELYGKKNPKPKPFYTLAAHMAENGHSFADIFSDQIEKRIRVKLKRPTNMPIPNIASLPTKTQEHILNKAWLTTYRVMRGHIEMSNSAKFAMSKDIGYLRGYHMDQSLLENGMGILNEEGIIASGVLPILTEMHLEEEDLPIPFQDLAVEYFNEILFPQMPEKMGQKLNTTTSHGTSSENDHQISA